MKIDIWNKHWIKPYTGNSSVHMVMYIIVVYGIMQVQCTVSCKGIYFASIIQRITLHEAIHQNSNKHLLICCS